MTNAATAVTTTVSAHHAASDCPNCGAVVSGNFCHACGQETALHPPSAREFVHEFIGHYIALEGKLWKSLLLLLFRPGQLTLEYIKGRRVRYIQPLRLYLTFSLIFFAVMKYTGHDGVQIGHGTRHPAAAAMPDKTNDKANDSAALVREDRPGEIAEGTAVLRKGIAGINAHWAERADRFGNMPAEERNEVLKAAFYGYVPYAVFFMMPLFALYLKGLYVGSGRRYGEHLLFGLHANGFAFLAMTLMMLLPGFLGLVSWALGLWLVVYTPVAMQRVYGGGRFLTGVRWIVLMALHMVGIGLAIGAAVGFGILH